MKLSRNDNGLFPSRASGGPTPTVLRIFEEYQRLAALCKEQGLPWQRDPCYGDRSGAVFARDAFQDFGLNPVTDTELVFSLVNPASGLRRSNIQVSRAGDPLTRLPPVGAHGSTRWDRG